MNSIILKISIIIAFFIFNEPEYLNSNSSLSGDWEGEYFWKCSNGGEESITLSLIDNDGVISGKIKLFNSTYQIKGFRLNDAELGEWQYEKGQLTESGNNIVLQLIDPKDSGKTMNIFSGELENDIIKGITMNGKQCSSFKGPSGNFKIRKIHI